MEMAMIVRDVGELRRLTRRRPSFFPTPGLAVKLEIPGLPYDRRQRWEARLNDHAGACGCDGGAIALAMVLCACVVLRGVLGVRILGKPGHETAAWMMLGGIGAVTGKALALHRSRHIVRFVREEVQAAQAASVSAFVR
jgi:hypothetical protein